MCGIAGSWQTGHSDSYEEWHRSTLHRLAHRGPDDSGVYQDLTASVTLLHTRLSILDLSKAGHQPMVSRCGRFVIVFNGEIYNHEEIRRDLPGSTGAWRGHSDTETLLEAILRWGIQRTLPKLNGMFALALWDSRDHVLTLARDRIGIKPVYYGQFGDTILFGSELKAMKDHPEFTGDLDRSSLATYIRLGYIPSPYSIYAGVRKLRPGHLIRFERGAPSCDQESYWRLSEVATAGFADRRAGVPRDGLLEEFETLLRDAVELRMRSDVPYGAFLSGGIDSSTVAALMQASSTRPIRTFSIGFHEPEHDEASFARSIAAYLGTEHTEEYVGGDEALAVIPSLPEVWDEPFGDTSQIPTLLVSRLARRDVTVCLSGDGGDELAYGYKRYELIMRAWRMIATMPHPVRHLTRACITRMPISLLDAVGTGATRGRFSHAGDRFKKLASLLDSRTFEQLYGGWISAVKRPTRLVVGSEDYLMSMPGFAPDQLRLSHQERMMLIDTLYYLPDDILTKLDRASMAFGLEARVPFLDHRLVELAWRAPSAVRGDAQSPKRMIRQVLARYVPRALWERPKAGFDAPIEQWLRGPLRAWAEDLLATTILRADGYFDVSGVRNIWCEHRDGVRRWHQPIWNLLMFQAWYHWTNR